MDKKVSVNRLSPAVRFQGRSHQDHPDLLPDSRLRGVIVISEGELLP
jgi:hypothetical protein